MKRRNRNSNPYYLFFEKECVRSYVIPVDERSAYSNFYAMRYQHFTVNRLQHYVDPATGS